MKALAILCFTLLITFNLQGAEVGKLYVDQGIIQVVRDNRAVRYRPSKRGIPLKKQDRIRTAANTRGKIVFKLDGSEVRLYEQSFLLVSRVLPTDVRLELKVGRAFFNVAKRFRRKFRVRTVDAVIGIKGTEFVVITKGHTSHVATLDGLVSFTSLVNPSWTVDIAPGKISSVRRGNRPTPPVDLSPKEKKALENLGKSASPGKGKDQKPDDIASEVDEEEEDLETIEEAGEETLPEEPEVPGEVQEAQDILSDLQNQTSTTEEEGIQSRETQKSFESINIIIKDL